MNRLICCLSALLLLSISHLFAQRLPQFDLTEELIAELSLTDEQVTRLEALQAETREKLDVIRAHETADHDTRRAHTKSARRAGRQELADILSEEQLTQLRAIQRSRAEERRALWDTVDKEAMRAEIKAYRTANVKPVMDVQYAKLAEQISPADQTQINEWRVLVRTERESRRAARKATESKARHRERSGRRGKVTQRLPEDVQEGIANMLEKYDAALTALLAEITPQAQAWETAQADIRAKYIPAALRREKPPVPSTDPSNDSRAKMRLLFHQL
ncbi:MAG: hypothetical protein AAGJ82_09580 [Bacteroidota bacterium]